MLLQPLIILPFVALVFKFVPNLQQLDFVEKWRKGGCGNVVKYTIGNDSIMGPVLPTHISHCFAIYTNVTILHPKKIRFYFHKWVQRPVGSLGSNSDNTSLSSILLTAP